MELKIPIEKIIESLPGGHKIYENPAEYDIAIHKHPFLKEMKERIFEFAKQHLNENSRIFEYGAGTGNLTEVLADLPFGYFLITEDDKKSYEFLKNKLGNNPRLTFEMRNIAKESNDKPFDIIFSSIADHHIPFDQKINALRVIFSLLKPGGYFIVGEELLDEFKDEASRIEALKSYHGAIIQKSIERGYFLTAESESMALKNGVDSFDEHKVSKNQHLKNLKEAGFNLVLAEKMGPDDGRDQGVYVIAAQRSK